MSYRTLIMAHGTVQCEGHGERHQHTFAARVDCAEARLAVSACGGGDQSGGWYHASLARWFMHVNIIAWTDIKYKLDATAHLPCESLRKPLEVIEACWDDPHVSKPWTLEAEPLIFDL